MKVVVESTIGATPGCVAVTPSAATILARSANASVFQFDQCAEIPRYTTQERLQTTKSTLNIAGYRRVRDEWTFRPTRVGWGIKHGGLCCVRMYRQRWTRRRMDRLPLSPANS